MTDLASHTLGDLVSSRSGAARVFERAGLDYCCRGQRNLADACAAAGLDPAIVAAEIEATERMAEPAWASLPVPALADHIVATHHAYLRDEMPLLEALADKVEGVHVRHHPELERVRELVSELWADLEPHLDKEELVLFPALRALVEDQRTDFRFGTVANPIRMMMAEHDRAGELLAALRQATGDFEPPADACASYRSLYQRLEALELDTHLHVHKENNVLFPAALRVWDELAGATGGTDWEVSSR
jgi:regulator of cell morphogenesis and NO signaling